MKIVIVGSVGSGKTTMAKRLSLELHINWYELDAIAYDDSKGGRPKRDAKEQMEIIYDINKNNSWILEGVPRESYSQIFELTDNIILLQPLKPKTYFRIIYRFIKQRLGIEMAHYKPTFYMLCMMFKWASVFYQQQSQFEQKLKGYNKNIIKIASTEEELCQLLKNLS